MRDKTGQFETCSAHHPLGLKTRSQRAAPVALPATPPFAAVAQALATAAAALADAAKALSQSENFSRTEPDKMLDAPAKIGRLPVPLNQPDALSVGEVVNAFLVHKARLQKSERYLGALRNSLHNFARGRHHTPLQAVTLQDVEGWIFGQRIEPKTMRSYLGDLRCLLRWCVKRGYCAADLTQGVELPIEKGSAPPAIHTPEQVRAVLEYARRANPDACRLLAVRYFAGIRTAEAFRLREENLLIDRGYIEVPCAKAKTRARRLVKIQPNLLAWLKLPGTLRPMAQDTLRRIIRTAAVDWRGNVTRHSFVTYHLAMFENAGQTALQAGHTEEMTHAHYKALVTRAEAELFWGIFPAS